MIKENIVVGEGTEFPLNGLLTLPDELTQPVPAVVMVHGSGPSNMDERVMKLTPFMDLAEGLAKQGIASLRYDKRTFVYARKMARLKGLTVKEETVDDALLAMDLLRNDSRIDADRIFILGHSMGAMLAPRIDAEGGNARGMILLAGTPLRLEEIVFRQLKQANYRNPLLKRIIAMESRLYTRKFSHLYELNDEEAKKQKFAGNLSLYYFKEMGLKTASDYLLQNEKPILILQGGRDFQVLANEDYQRFQEELATRKNTSFKLYPELNHCFVQAIQDDISKVSIEYGTERHIGEEVIGDIADFIRNN